MGRILMDISAITTPNLLHTIFQLHARLGFEIGRTFRVFQDNDYNWGFFADHDPWDMHCNAHLNNYIVLAPGEESSKNLLAPVDFDLAFTRTDFVHLLREDVDSYGLQDNTIFDMFLGNQRYPLELGVAGIENMDFMYNTVAFKGNSIAAEVEKDSTRRKYDMVMTMMKDALLFGYRRGFNSPEKSIFEEVVND